MDTHGSSRRVTVFFLSTLLAAALLSACDKEVVEPPDRIRAVKTIVVAERASGQMRKFPGTVEPVDTSSISFEVSGLVQEVRVERGDKVKVGEVLAVLDKKPFELNVESAKASLSRAKAKLKETKSAYEREQRIQNVDPGATTQKAVEQARAGYESTVQNVSYSQAQLNLARRDLEKTELRAPFDGVVSARDVEPFEEVTRGKPVLELFVEGAMEVAVSVPENMIGDVHVGLRGEVRLPDWPNVYQAVVSRVGSAAISANAFPVEANINDADEHVRPGMTAELTLLFSRGEEESAYLVPVQSLLPATAEGARISVYVFDRETSTVRRTPLEGRGMIGDQAIVTKGLAPGDIVVVAGVPFLRDGQEVKLMNPSQVSQ